MMNVKCVFTAVWVFLCRPASKQAYPESRGRRQTGTHSEAQAQPGEAGGEAVARVSDHLQTQKHPHAYEQRVIAGWFIN